MNVAEFYYLKQDLSYKVSNISLYLLSKIKKRNQSVKISCLWCECTGNKQTKKLNCNCNVITVFSTAVYHIQHCSDQYWSTSWGHVITASSNSCSASEGVVSILQKDAAVSDQKCFPSDLINTASSSSSSSGLLGSFFIDLT